jgi:hypothetical protein
MVLDLLGAVQGDRVFAKNSASTPPRKGTCLKSDDTVARLPLAPSRWGFSRERIADFWISWLEWDL